MQFRKEIRNIIIIDIILYLIGIAGIYHLAQRAGFNSTTHIEFKAADHDLIVNKVFDPQLTKYFQTTDRIIHLDYHQVQSVDELEMICDAYPIGKIVSIDLIRASSQLSEAIKLPAFYSLTYLIIVTFIGCALSGYMMFFLHAGLHLNMLLVWFLWVVFMDTPHFYNTYLRTYFDNEEFKKSKAIAHRQFKLAYHRSCSCRCILLILYSGHRRLYDSLHFVCHFL